MSSLTGTTSNVTSAVDDYSYPQASMRIANNPNAQSEVAELESCSYPKGLIEPMNNRSLVFSLLDSFYSGSQGAISLGEVVEINNDYQTLIKDSANQSKYFEGKCLQAIQQIKLAIQILEDNKFVEDIKLSYAFNEYDKCSGIATDMAGKSVKFVEQAKKLLGLTSVVLLQVSRSNDEDRVVSSLMLTVSTLISIRKYVDNIRVFWEGVITNCVFLSDLDLVQGHVDHGYIDEMKEELKLNCWRWIDLGKGIQVVMLKFQEISIDEDKSMSKLQNKAVQHLDESTANTSITNAVSNVDTKSQEVSCSLLYRGRNKIEKFNQDIEPIIKLSDNIKKIIIIATIVSLFIYALFCTYFTTQSNE